MVQQHRRELVYLGSQMNKPGYLDEMKSPPVRIYAV